MNDINLFRELVSCESAYEIFSWYHLFPGAINFYADYIKIKGGRSLLKRLEDNLCKTILEAVMYGNLNESAKMKEQVNWKKGIKGERAFDESDEDYNEESYLLRLHQPVKYSTPFAKPDPSITQCCIDGLSFIWLSSATDYYEAGCVLHNCLSSWRRFDNPVVVVKKHNITMAAIEIDVLHRFVVQARMTNNGIINSDSKLGRAYEKWKTRFSLEEKCNGYYIDL